MNLGVLRLILPENSQKKTATGNPVFKIAFKGQQQVGRKGGRRNNLSVHSKSTQTATESPLCGRHHLLRQLPLPGEGRPIASPRFYHILQRYVWGLFFTFIQFTKLDP